MSAIARVPDGYLARWLQGYFAGGVRWFGADLCTVAAESTSEGASACDALKQVFPWTWVAGLGDAGARHPVVQMQMWRRSAASLIELGVMLLRYPAVAKATSWRLRSPEHFASVVAELQIGRLLAEAGASLTHEPAGVHPRKLDWLARWPDLGATIEVKQPRVSHQAQRALHGETALLWAIGRHPAFPRPTAPAWLTLHVHPDLDERWRRQDDVEDAEFERIARVVVPELARRLPRPTRATVVEFEGIAAFEVELTGLPGPATFHFSGYGPQVDSEHEANRVARTLLKAANQLQGTGNLRIVALHLGQDGLITNHLSEIRSRLASAQWAQNIDGLLLVGCYDHELRTCNRLIRGPTRNPDLRRFAERMGPALE